MGLLVGSSLLRAERVAVANYASLAAQLPAFARFAEKRERSAS
jgi:hypothetical protein